MGTGPHTEQERIARECGLRLLEISEIYERCVIEYGAGHATLAIVGLVARQRRLLRAAYLLADADQRLEASVFIRAMQEFLIRQKWLQLDPELHHVLWSLEDFRLRLKIDEEITAWAKSEGVALAPILKPEVRDEYERQRGWLQKQLTKISDERGLPKAPSYPGLQQQANDVKLGLVYSLAYRFDSQTAAHPSALAIEQLLRDRPDLGGVEVLADPPVERTYADPYATGAFILRDAFASAATHIPEVELDGFDDVAQRLEEITPTPDANDG